MAKAATKETGIKLVTDKFFGEEELYSSTEVKPLGQTPPGIVSVPDHPEPSFEILERAYPPYYFDDDLNAEWEERQELVDFNRRPVPAYVPPATQVCDPSGQMEMFKSRADYPQIKIDGRIEQVTNKQGKDGETIFKIVFVHDTRSPREVAGDLSVLGQVFCTMQLGGSIVSVKGD